MKLFRPWVMASVVALAACGDGLKSPDFTPVNTFVGLEIVPAVSGQGTEIPAGTSLGFKAMAMFTQTVPPGTRDELTGNPISVREAEEDVTGQAAWSSSAGAVASVDAGVVNGLVASSAPVTITAAFAPEGFESQSGSVQVTVTDAIVEGVEYVKPAGIPRSASNTYTVTVDGSSNFEIYGRFSDDQVRQLTGANYVVAWSSSDPDVLNNPAGDQVFDGVSIGTAGVTGQVTAPDEVTPDSATATVNVRQLSELCLSEFLAPEAQARQGPLSTGCEIGGCTASATENMIDGDEETAASLSIPVGLLLQSNVSAEVYDTTTVRLLAGQQVGFVVSKPMDLLAASLLQDVSIVTLNCTAGDPVACEEVQTFSGRDPSAPLYVSLLGLLGGEPAALVQTDPLESNANGMRIVFGGGLLSLLATLNVNAACSATAAPVAP